MKSKDRLATTIFFVLFLFTPGNAPDIRTYSYFQGEGVPAAIKFKKARNQRTELVEGPSRAARCAARAARREERAIQLCDCVIDIISALLGVPSRELRELSRVSHEIARVRQLAMYVAHVTLRLKMRDIGLGFGRDRTTVLYACHTIEDLRDDTDFDRLVATTERVVIAALQGRFDLA